MSTLPLPGVTEIRHGATLSGVASDVEMAANPAKLHVEVKGSPSVAANMGDAGTPVDVDLFSKVEESSVSLRQLAFWKEVGGILCQSYLLCYGFFGAGVLSYELVWFHFLNPTVGAFEPSGVVVLFVVIGMLPLLFEARALYKLAVKFNLVFQALIPPGLILLTMIPIPFQLRFHFSVTAWLSSSISLIGTLGRPPNSTQHRRLSGSFFVGLLLYQGLRMAGSSAIVFLNHGDAVFFAFKAIFALGSVACGYYLHWEARKEKQNDFDFPKTECCFGRNSAATPCNWSWLLNAVMLASFTNLIVCYFSNVESLFKYPRHSAPTFPAAISVPFLEILGLFVARLCLGKHSLLRLVVIMLNVLAVGVFSSGSHFVGGLILSISLAPTWIAVFDGLQASAKDFTLARTFAVSGILTVVYIYLYAGVFSWKHTPVVGEAMGEGGVEGYTWMLVSLLLLCMLARELYLRFLAKVNGQISVVAVSRPRLAAIILVITLVHIPGWIRRGVLLSPSVSASSETKIKILAYNNLNGYDTAGRFNGICFSDEIAKHEPDFVAISEDAFMFYSDRLRYYRDPGPASSQVFPGIAIFSSRPLKNVKYHVLPKPSSGDITRFAVSTRVTVNGVDILLVSLHLEWYGDPRVQTEFLASEFGTLSQPVILLGDFNLMPNGFNFNSLKDETATDAWQPLLNAGFVTSTPLNCIDSTSGKNCKSGFSTCLVGSECSFPCTGYQLDWILYKGSQLSFDSGSNTEVRGYMSGSGSDSIYCSDHAGIMSTFTVTP